MNNKKHLFYMFLSFCNVFTGLIVWVFIMNLFGVSVLSDAYFLAVTVINGIQLIELMVTEQFIFFYNDIKQLGKLEAERFYSSSFFFSLLTGFLIFFLCFLFREQLISIFLDKLTFEEHKRIASLLNILFVWLMLYPTQQIIEKYLNAEEYFALPYILLTAQNVLVIIAMQLMKIGVIEMKIETLATVRSSGVFFTFLISIAYTILHKCSYKTTLFNKHLKLMIVNSVKMRFAHNIHNFLITIITTKMLSSLAVGNVSYFYYAQKAIMTTREIVIGPAYKVYQSRIAYYWAKNEFQTILNGVKRFAKYNLILFSLVATSCFFMIPVIIPIISHGISDIAISTIQKVYLMFYLWQMINIYEFGYIPIAMAVKKSRVFLAVNSIYIVIFYVVIVVLLNYIGIYSIVVAGLVAQLFNCASYRKYSLKHIMEKV